MMPYRKPADGGLPGWQEELNAVHRTIHARVEHTLTRMKCWKILRDHRRAASKPADTVAEIAHPHNTALARRQNPVDPTKDQIPDSPSAANHRISHITGWIVTRSQAVRLPLLRDSRSSGKTTATAAVPTATTAPELDSP
jgi:hypothetical protein